EPLGMTRQRGGADRVEVDIDDRVTDVEPVHLLDRVLDRLAPFRQGRVVFEQMLDLGGRGPRRREPDHRVHHVDGVGAAHCHHGSMEPYDSTRGLYKNRMEPYY